MLVDDNKTSLSVDDALCLSEEVEDRISYISRDRWFEFHYVTPIMETIDRMVRQPPRVRPKCMLVVAESGMGKSALVAEVCRRFPSYRNKRSSVTSQPVLACELEPPASPQKLLGGICAAANLAAITLSTRDLQPFIKEQLHALDVKIIIVDEINSILSVNPNVAQNCCDILKWLGNASRRPVVAMGTPDVIPFFSRDSQLRRRFKRRELPLWNLSPELQSFVKTILTQLPMKEPADSVFWQEEGLEKLLIKSERTTDGLVESIHDAAIHALLDGREKIVLEDLQAGD